MAHQTNGAESKNGTTEAQINLQIVLKIQQLLEQSGCTVILTRSDENAIYDLDAKTLKHDEYVNVSSGDRSNWIDIITYASIAEQWAKEIGEIASDINTNGNQLNMDVESITARCSVIESTFKSIRDRIQMMYDITE